jgi:amidophosphoribosyltransferase
MCGIAGAYGVPDASRVVSLMLKAMQHRGQEAAGIVSADKAGLHETKGFGLVDEVFAGVDFGERLPGTAAIGHIRYATCGDADDGRNVQPLVVKLRHGATAIVHNGNLTNYPVMRATLEENGAIFQTSSDTELFLHLLARARKDTGRERFKDAAEFVEGAYSVLLLSQDGLIAAVDPYGFRPLSATRYGDGWLFASETCAFDLFGAGPGTPLEPRNVFEISKGQASTTWLTEDPGVKRHCSFEHIYFTRPDSAIFGVRAGMIRERLGTALAKATGRKTDIVTSVPDSSNAIGAAYAHELGIPFRFALIRNHYTGRTFITPKQTARELGVRMKLNADRHVVEGKTVTVVDDSLVRGTTARKIVELLRSAGAKEVHLRIGSPPVIHPCFWGIDTPSRQELIAADLSPAELAKLLGADSLEYLPITALNAALGDETGDSHCTTCFSGSAPHEVPIPLTRLLRKSQPS